MLILRHFIAIATVAASVIAFGQSDPVIVINGRPIERAEYVRRMEVLPGIGSMINGQFAEAPPGFLTLLRMIDEALIEDLAKQKGLLPTKAEVDAEIQSKMEANPKLIESLMEIGVTRADLERQVRIDLCEFRLISEGITVTDQEVEKFYNDNKPMFIQPKRYKLRVLAVKEDGKAACDQELANKTPFAEVARKHSIDATKPIGGLLGELPEESFSDSTKAAIQAIQVGQYTDWIKGETTFVRFYLEDVIPAKKQDLDAQARKFIRERMMRDRGMNKNDIGKMLNMMRAKAVVEIKSTRFADDLKAYLEAIRKSASTNGG